MLACVFKSTKTPNLYIGKIRKRFLTAEVNEKGYVAAVEMDIFREHKALLKDIDVIPIKDVFMGPLEGIYRENGKWEFPQYLNVKKIFEKIKNVKRDSIYNTYICKKYP